MFRLPTQLKTTGNDILRSVSATTSVITHGAESLSALAEAGSLHAQAFRDNAAADIAENAGTRRSLTVNRAKLTVAKGLLDIRKDLDADPELWDIFDSLNDSDFTFTRASDEPSPNLTLVAAE